MSESQVFKILENWTVEKDTNPSWEERSYAWPWPNNLRFKRRLTDSERKLVYTYINIIVKRYPHGVRWLMGKDLWIEFCEYFSVNPNVNQALRYL